MEINCINCSNFEITEPVKTRRKSPLTPLKNDAYENLMDKTSPTGHPPNVRKNVKQRENEDKISKAKLFNLGEYSPQTPVKHEIHQSSRNPITYEGFMQLHYKGVKRFDD